ncbi:MAG: HipA N-terminal domain-containing protein [Crocinitomicaceae bacterium]|nr:HipA N-terminal domain-containing protein [Crocinitomicaceae bacterium]
MNRSGKVYYKDEYCGLIYETDEGYFFQYDATYAEKKQAQPISATLPLKQEKYHSKVLFPFFDGLIPEGWLLDIAETNWKINYRDRMGLLLICCKDCIGAVSIVKE